MNALTVQVAPNGCHLCTSHKPNRSGYPEARYQGRVRRVHQIVFDLCCDDLQPGQVVRHTCDNPLCINPEHLVAGTHADNVQDRVERGRSAKGERNGRAKLTPAQVLEIRASSAPDLTLAQVHSVHPRTIAFIRSGQNWKHLLPGGQARAPLSLQGTSSSLRARVAADLNETAELEPTP